MKTKKYISIACPTLNGNEKKYVNDCLDTVWISSIGKYINKFEEEFAKYCGVKHAIVCSNGTVALHLPLLAYDIKPGDEIVLPTLTYIATANVVKYCGATPVLVDSEKDAWNIDPTKIEEKITNRTKGIIVVHLYGHPVDMDPILKLAKKYNLFIIEDASEAHGAEYKNRKVGSIGNVGTFSFYGNKIITAGEGGMVVTNSNTLAGKVRLLKGQGMDPKHRYWFPIIGYNYRMTNIQAAIGLAQLEKIDWHMKKREIIAEKYQRRLNKLKDFIETQKEKAWAHHAYWMFNIVLKSNLNISRDSFMKKLEEKGIETRPIFYPMHIMPPYLDKLCKYPVADYVSSRGISLPSHANLNNKDIEYVTNQIEQIIQSCLGNQVK